MFHEGCTHRQAAVENPFLLYKQILNSLGMQFNYSVMYYRHFLIIIIMGLEKNVMALTYSLQEKLVSCIKYKIIFKV